MNRQLIVNADDYGLSAGVSTGIRDCHLHGLVTSTTAMMNMPGVGAALQEAMRDCPGLGLGVHLVLTTGRPVLPAVQVASLLLEEGLFPNEAGMIERLSRIHVEEVRAEWTAQVEKFVALTGREPDHLDSHHHMSYLSPDLFEVMAEIAAAHHCGIRFPEEAVARELLSDFPLEQAEKTARKTAQLAGQYYLAHPDHFVKSFYGEDATLAALTAILESLPEGTTEIMCHPAYIDQPLMDSSSYHTGRAGEYAVLTDARILTLLPEKGIRLTNFQEIVRAGGTDAGSNPSSS